MTEFIKTIVSAIQTWVKGLIKESTADWNQCDAEASDYIKNRTHYEEEVFETEVILAETTVEISEGGDYYMLLPGECTFIEGDTYTVVFNGVDYKCVAWYWEENDATVIGNGSIYGDPNYGNDEPFSCDSYDGDCYLNVAGAGTYTISISQSSSNIVVHQLDEKYIADSLSEKMNKNNPVGVGSFSMNRLADTTIGNYSHAEGYNTTASGYGSHAEGNHTMASEDYSHAEGNGTIASGARSHAEGGNTVASGDNSHAEGDGTTASGYGSHAEGCKTTVTNDTTVTASVTSLDIKGYYGHAEGYGTVVTGVASHAEGNGTTASGNYSHAEGNGTTASGNYSHTEGHNTTASGDFSHAEGQGTAASGKHSHAEGWLTKAKGQCSHAQGYYTIASGTYSHAEGKYNVEDANGIYAHIVGNGTSDTARSNAYALDWSGNAWFAGDVQATDENGNTISLIETANTQSDWNQMDETASDYVKNRIAYKYENPKPVLFEGTVVLENHTNNSGNTRPLYVLPEDFNIPFYPNIANTFSVYINDIVVPNLTPAMNTTTGAYALSIYADGTNYGTIIVGTSYDIDQYVIYFGSTLGFTDGDSVYIKIVDDRELLYNYLPADLLPPELGEPADANFSWIFGKSGVNQLAVDKSVLIGDKNNFAISNYGSGNLIVGYNNQNIEGQTTQFSLVAGNSNIVSGSSMICLGTSLKACNYKQVVLGAHNETDPNYGKYYNTGQYILIVGNGTSDTARSNAHTLDWDGNAWFAGDVYTGGTSQSEGSKLITEIEVDTKLEGKSDTSHTHNYAGSSSAGGAATSANKINTDAGSATQPVYFANGVPVATTYTLGKSVPSDAVFTDTTYSAATTSANGLMSSTDKAKLDNTNIAYGTCSTDAATAAKVITVSGNTNWSLKAGSMITVLFSATNTAESPTFNVNGTGAKNVFYGANQITTGSLSYAGYANRPMNFMYDGTQYRFIGWGADSNTDTKVQQNAAITTAGEYPVLLAYSTSTSKVTNAVQKTTTLKYNPSTQTLSVPNISLDGVDLGTTLGDISTALTSILGV